MNHGTITLRLLPLIIATLVLGACRDATDAGRHITAYGIAIMAADAEIYRHVDTGTVAPPTLTLVRGTHDVAIVLLDHTGRPIEETAADHDEHDVHVLTITIADPEILAWIQEDHDDVHEHVEFHGELDALADGSTTMTVCVPHGSHCDFEIVEIPVTVE